MIRVQQFIAILIVAGSAFSIFSGSDQYFPFSPYPMYSKLFVTPAVYTYRDVQGVTESGEEARLRITRVLPPFWLASFREALLVDRSDTARTSKLRATLAWYNDRLIRAGNTATFKGLRLYRFELPWSELTASALENRGLSKVFRDHALVELEVAK
ncbi:hypothetical protein BH10BDE1_BH10BDE1_04530 [soil metagenome]